MVNRRKALESLWQGTCTVIVREEQKNPEHKRTDFVECEKYTDQPCHLSFKSKTSVGDGVAALVTQTTTLFLAPEIVIPPGSKIRVTQRGVTKDYVRSGEPRLYNHHQEIDLELFKKWA